MMRQAGRMDRRITIQRVVYNQDSFGQPVETWSDYQTCWAHVEYPSASERFESDALHSTKSANFTIRNIQELDETMRILYQDLYWKITGIIEIGRREGFEISAEVFK